MRASTSVSMPLMQFFAYVAVFYSAKDDMRVRASGLRERRRTTTKPLETYARMHSGVKNRETNANVFVTETHKTEKKNDKGRGAAEKAPSEVMNSIPIGSRTLGKEKTGCGYGRCHEAGEIHLHDESIVPSPTSPAPTVAAPTVPATTAPAPEDYDDDGENDDETDDETDDENDDEADGDNDDKLDEEEWSLQSSPSPAPVAVPTEPQVAMYCNDWCATSDTEWEEKCQWTTYCGSCPECVKTASPTVAPTTMSPTNAPSKSPEASEVVPASISPTTSHPTNSPTDAPTEPQMETLPSGNTTDSNGTVEDFSTSSPETDDSQSGSNSSTTLPSTNATNTTLSQTVPSTPTAESVASSPTGLQIAGAVIAAVFVATIIGFVLFGSLLAG